MGLQGERACAPRRRLNGLASHLSLSVQLEEAGASGCWDSDVYEECWRVRGEVKLRAHYEKESREFGQQCNPQKIW